MKEPCRGSKTRSNSRENARLYEHASSSWRERYLLNKPHFPFVLFYIFLSKYKCDIPGETTAAGARAKPTGVREHPADAQAGDAASGELTQVKQSFTERTFCKPVLC